MLSARIHTTDYLLTWLQFDWSLVLHLPIQPRAPTQTQTKQPTESTCSSIESAHHWRVDWPVGKFADSPNSFGGKAESVRIWNEMELIEHGIFYHSCNFCGASIYSWFFERNVCRYYGEKWAKADITDSVYVCICVCRTVRVLIDSSLAWFV